MRKEAIVTTAIPVTATIAGAMGRDEVQAVAATIMMPLFMGRSLALKGAGVISGIVVMMQIRKHPWLIHSSPNHLALALSMGAVEISMFILDQGLLEPPGILMRWSMLRCISLLIFAMMMSANFLLLSTHGPLSTATAAAIILIIIVIRVLPAITTALGRC